MGIEALSRGATTATFVESQSATATLLQNNLQACALMDRAQVRIGQTDAFLKRTDWWDGPYDIIFADPPYAAYDELALLSHLWKPGLFSEHAVIIIEQDSRTEHPHSIDHATLIRRYEYGDTALGLYRLSSSAASEA